jgi:exonuclease V gamma subunit
MLHKLQRDIFNASIAVIKKIPKRRSGKRLDSDPRLSFANEEIEVLYDHLLERLSRIDLETARHPVMTPNIESTDRSSTPCSTTPRLTDNPFQSAWQTGVPAPVRPSKLSSLLALPGGRCTASEIFSLLERISIHRRFHSQMKK